LSTTHELVKAELRIISRKDRKRGKRQTSGEKTRGERSYCRKRKRKKEGTSLQTHRLKQMK